MWLLAILALQDVEAGRKAFDRCASCHAVPDPRLRWDQAWLGMVTSSACASPEERRAVLPFLSSELTPRPVRVDAEAPIAADKGTVIANIEEGYLHLAPKQEKPRKNEPIEFLGGYRLVWKKDEKERRRPVTPGTYYVRRYVASRDDPKTGEWTLMATGLGRPVEVKAGQETKVTLDLDVTFKAEPGRKGAKIIVGGRFTGDREMGLSVFKNNRRLEVGWKVMDGKQDVAAGGCTYGAEGGFAGTLDVSPGQRAGIARYFFDLAMFKLKGDPREGPIR